MENEDPFLVIGRLNYYSAKETVWIKNILQHHKFENEICQSLKRYNKKGLKIGIAGEHLMPFYLRDILTRAMPDVEFPIVTEILDDMRKIKSPKEIELMEKAAEINDKVLTELKKIIKVGMTEQQVVAHADFLGRQLGADLGSATVVMSGKNTKFPAWRATEKKLEKGELLMVDFNPTIGHYCNDGGLTFLLPGASKYKTNALINSHKILKETIKSIKSQTKATSVHDKFYEMLKPLELEPKFSPYVTGTRGTGHGVGLDVVESPDLNKHSDFVFYRILSVGRADAGQRMVSRRFYPKHDRTPQSPVAYAHYWRRTAPSSGRVFYRTAGRRSTAVESARSQRTARLRSGHGLGRSRAGRDVLGRICCARYAAHYAGLWRC